VKTIRVGLFGGSFDPPHLTHLALARCARDALALDELRWQPAGRPWQKQGVGIAPAEHRRAMVELLIAGEPGFSLDARELERAGPSYTIDTLRELRAEFAARGAAAEFFVVIGQDQAAHIDTWHDWRELVGGATLAVAARAGRPVAPAAALAAVPHRVVTIALPPSDISSTRIRALAARGEDLRPLVGDAVAGYIAQHRLYLKHSSEHCMDIRKLQRAIVDGLEDVKAQNIQVFNTEHLSPLFERVVIASGTSNRQTKALASSVRETVKGRGMQIMRTEGEDNGEWIIVDCGAAVVHVMQPAIRDYYHLEEIWGGKPVKLKPAETGRKGLVKASDAEDEDEEDKPVARKKADAKKAAKAADKAEKSEKAGKKAAPAAKKAAAKAPAKKAAPAKKGVSKTVGTKRGAAAAPVKTVKVGAAKPAAKPAAKKSAAPTKKAAAPAKKAAAKAAPRAAAKPAAKPAAKKAAPAKKSARAKA